MLALAGWGLFGHGGDGRHADLADRPATGLPTGLPTGVPTGVPTDAPGSDPSASAPAGVASPGAPASPTPGPRRPPGPSPTGGRTQTYLVTLYGGRDNTPPGSAEIAYPKVHKQAGGTGTFRDPVTFATDKTELAIGTIVYYPYLKRYFVMEDECVECHQDWVGHGPDGGPRFAHIDLWAGGSTNAGITDCENALTRSGPVVVNPSANLPVDTTPLYDGHRCYQPA